MAIKTKISYCDSTVNPMMGCTGCELYHPDPKKNHCYAANMTRRYAGNAGWPTMFTKPKHFPSRLAKALRWRDLTGTQRDNKPWLDEYPRVIFVNDLSDGFCPDADPELWLTPYLEQMAASPHIWLLLTKWPHRMRAYFKHREVPWNFWLGTSVLRQNDTWRIDELDLIKAKTKWISAEPLLGPINLSRPIDGVGGIHGGIPHISSVRWICVGGESGPNARPVYPEWVMSLQYQCRRAGVPYFFKQWGEWVAEGQLPEFEIVQPFEYPERHGVYLVGKKKAGCLLDGKEYHEMPNV